MERGHAPLPRYTGNHFVILPPDQRTPEGLSRLKQTIHRKTGISLVTTSEFGEQPITDEPLFVNGGLLYERLGMALVNGESDQVDTMGRMGRLIVEPERYVYVPEPGAHGTGPGPMGMLDWGLRATGVLDSAYTGAGVKVAILDTGIDLRHPGFQRRSITTASFVAEQTVQDLDGHGTHCAGVACGGVDEKGVRYGVATEAELFVGKVLKYDPERKRSVGSDSLVIAAIDWAIKQGCQVISLSLGSPALPSDEGYRFSLAYERIGQDALEHHCIPVAAAGNDCQHGNKVWRPVNYPANCESFLAVGAVDDGLKPADFSCCGRQLNLVAPGVQIYSSWLAEQGGYRLQSGTSMATPHVSGILALLWERNLPYKGKTRGNARAIVQQLLKSTRKLGLRRDYQGAGLVQAP